MKCKYAWSHIDFKKGGYAPCFRFKNWHLKDCGPDKLPSEVINGKEFIQVRRQLRNDEWPLGCIDCKIQEEAGLSSYRTRSLDISHISEPNYDSDIVHIKDLQLKMTRACNYQCRHCDSASNSRFEQTGKQFPAIELKLLHNFEFGHISKPKEKILIPNDEIMDDLFKNVIPWGVEAIEFSGGEPFYTRDMYKTLQRMIDDPDIWTQDISIIYNTNMSMLSYKEYSVKPLWPHFKNIFVTVSMDGTGDLFNYFRTGGDWENVINNVREIAPLVTKFLFVCTTSAYQAFYMNEIYKDFCEVRDSINTPAALRATFVHWPEVLDIVNLEDHAKNKILKETIKNDFTRDFLQRIKNRRNIDTCKGEFKELVKLQDELYGVSAKDMGLTKITEYINA